MAARAVRARHGDKAAAELLEGLERQAKAADQTRAKQRKAKAVSRSRVRREGRGAVEPEPPPAHLQKRREATAERKAAKVAKRRSKTVAGTLQARHEKDVTRAAKAAEAAADKALSTNGIRHSFRPIARVAWWSAYMAGCDRNGALALAALRSCGMPAHRQAQVLKAATEPQVYQPRRDVCRGERAGQQAFKAPGALERPKWEADGKRPVSHPAAIRVIQCAVFLWMSRTRTRRGGYMGRVRGFGRGVFAAVCQCGKDAIAGHTDGVPGALVALKQAGFVEYGQPPAEVVSEFDRGPSGFAYLLFWFRSSPAEMQLEAYHQRVREVASLPYVEQLAARPELLELREAAWGATDPPPDPPGFTEADIPF